jgi:integrase/recombinase XerD
VKRGAHVVVREVRRPDDAEGLLAWVRRHLVAMGAAGYSADTIRHREDGLWPFVAWCDGRELGRPREVTRDHVEGYQRWVFGYRQPSGKALSFRSQYQRLVHVKQYFRFLVRSRVLTVSPAAEIEMPKREKRLPRTVLSVAEVEALLGAADLATAAGVRDRALGELLYATGLRRRELARLLVHDLDDERRTVRVREGKGKKERLVPTGERALAWVNKYLVEVRDGWACGGERDEGRLFLTTRGTPMDGAAVTYVVQRLFAKSGLAKTGGPHVLRHTMATLMLENGADLLVIQSILGHERMETTEVYTHVAMGRLVEVHGRTHPVARLVRPAGAAAATLDK